MRKTTPRRGATVRSASKTVAIDRTNPSKPLNTDSSTIIAATGMATAATLRAAMRLTTAWDLGEKR